MKRILSTILVQFEIPANRKKDKKLIEKSFILDP